MINIFFPHVFRYFSTKHIDLLDRIPKVFLILGASTLTLQIIGNLLIFNAPNRKDDDEKKININDVENSNGNVESNESVDLTNNSIGVK